MEGGRARAHRAQDGTALVTGAVPPETPKPASSGVLPCEREGLILVHPTGLPVLSVPHNSLGGASNPTGNDRQPFGSNHLFA
jgi:hypothetical protein